MEMKKMMNSVYELESKIKRMEEGKLDQRCMIRNKSLEIKGLKNEISIISEEIILIKNTLITIQDNTYEQNINDTLGLLIKKIENLK